MADLHRLLEHCRVSNAARGITGMLLYSDGSCFQLLEGEEQLVGELLQTIVRDPRHQQVVVIIRETIAVRSFESWSMGFAVLDPRDVYSLVGTNDFFADAKCLRNLDRGRTKLLLSAFARGRWRSRLDAPERPQVA